MSMRSRPRTVMHCSKNAALNVPRCSLPLMDASVSSTPNSRSFSANEASVIPARATSALMRREAAFDQPDGVTNGFKVLVTNRRWQNYRSALRNKSSIYETIR